ncbi:AAA family ATPase, partial [Nonomuraea sp. NPDC005983]|uniref:AAA family ATPase n=1 Tax=Nonomuraea sp. NPDC005983 TaxID=3155595 RepID=UPI0033BEEE67
MRPHLLSLTAFGSFPGTETVDFDALTEAGLFLVHGPTGAGKTTILDALCFALYGVVPGQRGNARALRCDHAPPSTGPSVTLEVTIRGRLLRIQRSPVWQRPKLRGAGLTEEKAKVIVEERVGEGWQGLTTRSDEAGDLVGGLLGMNADQFCQVAMLPQGDFARFLRADGDDRRKLLERLFTVKIFTQAEHWLADHRTRTWRDQQELRQQVDFAIQRLEEAAGDELLSTLSAEPVSGTPLSEAVPSEAVPSEAVPSEAVPAPDTEPLRWAGALLDAARAVVARATDRQAQAEQALRVTRARFEQASSLAERRRRHAEALTLRRTLDERAEERADLQAVLDDAARADRVLPLVMAARQRAEAATKLRTLVADALARARPLLTSRTPIRASHGQASAEAGFPGSRAAGEASSASFAGWVEPEWLAALERERQAEMARLSELLTEEARLLVVRRDLRRVEDELTGLTVEDEAVAERLAVLPGLIEEAERRLARARTDSARVPVAQNVRDAAKDLIGVDGELARLAAELDGLADSEAEVAAAEADLPDRIADVNARLAEVRAEAATAPAAAATLDTARAVLETAHRRDALAAELDSAAATHQALVDRAQSLREHWLDIRQARIDGMAAELALDLSDGCPCAVCGSDQHPHPASPAPSAPSPEDEHAAESAHEAALAEREAAERALATLQSRHADAVEATGGLDAGAAEDAVLQGERELARVQAIADREPALAAELDRIETERERVRERARELAESLTANRTHRAHLQAERARLVSRLVQSDLTSRSGEDGGVPAESAPVVLAAAEEELRRLKESAGREPVLAAEAGGLAQERIALEERGRRVTARLAACRTRHEELSGDAGRLSARLDSARGDDPTLTARLSRLGDEAELLREALARRRSPSPRRRPASCELAAGRTPAPARTSAW